MIYSKKGFTLIEVLIYTVLLSFFISASFVFLNSILGSSDRILAKNELIANQDLILRKIHWLLFNQASSVTNPPAGSSSNLIEIKGHDAKTYSLNLNNGQILFSETGGSSTPITNNRVQVTKFNVEHFSNAQSNVTFKISLIFQNPVYQSINTSSTFFYNFSGLPYFIGTE